ncbi:RDD family protein [Pseudocolwellia agarivorans]|uniref:RDD family protein n=1 Tax=Pseudocolwellia agarivorans TaxID=1911682 RepID=UPI000984E8FD|nr:RDD family protein [Pseudocolwellia agarivorans]
MMQYQGLDNKFFIKLPEGVSINLVPAGIVVRSCAYLYDFFIRVIVFGLVAAILSFLGDAGQGLILIAYFIITWGYYIAFEAKSGTTPGKKRFNLKVVQDNGLPATLSNIIIRNLLRPADAFPFGYCLGIATMSFNKSYKRIGDWSAGTLVIYQENNVGTLLNSENTSQEEPPKIELAIDEQQAVIEFSERCKKLSPARQEELANILSEALNVKDESATNKLKSMANFYLGQKI